MIPISFEMTKIVEEINGLPRMQCKIRNTNPNIRLFQPGGSIWLTEYEWKEIGKFMDWKLEGEEK